MEQTANGSLEYEIEDMLVRSDNHVSDSSIKLIVNLVKRKENEARLDELTRLNEYEFTDKHFYGYNGERYLTRFHDLKSFKA